MNETGQSCWGGTQGERADMTQGKRRLKNEDTTFIFSPFLASVFSLSLIPAMATLRLHNQCICTPRRAAAVAARATAAPRGDADGALPRRAALLGAAVLGGVAAVGVRPVRAEDGQ